MLSPPERQRLAEQFRGRKELKLNLGCGQDYKPGWVNVDVDSTVRTDICANFTELDQILEPGSVTYIEMIHSIGYLPLWEARKLFSMLRGLLAPGGTLVIETPNLETMIPKIAENFGKNVHEYIDGLRGIIGFGWDHMDAGASFTPYSFTWSAWHLSLELGHVGFVDVKILPPQTHSPWRDMRIEAKRVRTPTQTALSRKKPKLLFLVDPQMGHVTAYIRGRIYEALFTNSELNCEYIDVRATSPEEIVKRSTDADLVYFLKVPFLELMQQIRNHSRAKIVFDLTDALWKPHHQAAGWKEIFPLLMGSDALFSDNDYILEYGRRFCPNVFKVLTTTNPERFEQIRATLAARNDHEVRLGWVGSDGTIGGLHALYEILESIGQQFPQASLHVLGCSNPQALPQFKALRTNVIGRYTEEEMMRAMLHFDIGLFPPPLDLEDYLMRGGLKGFLYMTAGVPALCYNDGELRSYIQDGINGMLATTADEWKTKLIALIASPELRRSMGQRAKERITAERSLPAVFRGLEKAFHQVLALPDQRNVQAQPRPGLTA